MFSVIQQSARVRWGPDRAPPPPPLGLQLPGAPRCTTARWRPSSLRRPPARPPLQGSPRPKSSLDVERPLLGRQALGLVSAVQGSDQPVHSNRSANVAGQGLAQECGLVEAAIRQPTGVQWDRNQRPLQPHDGRGHELCQRAGEVRSIAILQALDDGIEGWRVDAGTEHEGAVHPAQRCQRRQTAATGCAQRSGGDHATSCAASGRDEIQGEAQHAPPSAADAARFVRTARTGSGRSAAPGWPPRWCSLRRESRCRQP